MTDEIATSVEKSMGMLSVVPMIAVTGTTMRLVEKSFQPYRYKKRKR